MFRSPYTWQSLCQDSFRGFKEVFRGVGNLKVFTFYTVSVYQ